MPSAVCLIQDGSFWIYGVFALALVLAVAALALELARSPLSGRLAVAGIVAAVAIVPTGYLVLADGLPNGVEISPEVQRFAHEQRVLHDGQDAVEQGAREWRRRAAVECAQVSGAAAVPALLLALFVLVRRRVRARAT
jgi:hypothetical protein